MEMKGDVRQFENSFHLNNPGFDIGELLDNYGRYEVRTLGTGLKTS